MANVVKVSLLGTMPGGENWSVNPVFGLWPAALITAEQMALGVTAVNAVNVPSGLLSKWSPGTTLVGCRLESRDSDGTLDKVAEGTKAAPAVGTSGNALPFQSAVAVTLQTVNAGASGRGRIFWPATGVSLSTSTLRMSSSDTLAFAQVTDTYLTSIQVALESALSANLSLDVWSRTQASHTPVQKIKCGDIVDTQRRRRDALRESLQIIDYQGN